MNTIAKHFFRNMPGASQSKLLLGSDGNLWVVKFQNNPEQVRSLASEFIATGIAQALRLTAPRCAPVYVSSAFVRSNPDMVICGAGGAKIECTEGFHCGSQYAGGLMPGQVLDFLPRSALRNVTNLNELVGMLAFDIWTGNADARQVVYRRTAKRNGYKAFFIDQGRCFSGADWTFSHSTSSRRYTTQGTYSDVVGWSSFEPWLGRIEEFSSDRLWSLMQETPEEWYHEQTSELERLFYNLVARRPLVRKTITQLKIISPEMFPSWRLGTRKLTQAKRFPSNDRWLSAIGQLPFGTDANNQANRTNAAPLGAAR